MNNFIIGLIAIAIVSLISISGAWYGGDIYKEQKINGEVAKYTNESAQVNGALILFKSEGNDFDDNFKLSTLVEMNYLTQVPENWSEYEGTIGVKIEGNKEKSEKVCFIANKNAGFTYSNNEEDTVVYSQDTSYSIPLCTKSDIEKVPCCAL